MVRNTEKDGTAEHTAQCVPLSRDLDMQRLKRLVRELNEEGRETLDTLLDGGTENGIKAGDEGTTE